MSILPHQDLLQLIEAGVIDSRPEHVGPSSIDIHLGEEFLIEDPGWHHIVRPALGLGPKMKLCKGKVRLKPGAVCLAASRETVNLPPDITVSLDMRSTSGRTFLNHLKCGHIDPGFNGNITLELKNECQDYPMWLYAGDRVLQLIFHRHEPTDAPYRGAYQGDRGAQQAKEH